MNLRWTLCLVLCFPAGVSMMGTPNPSGPTTTQSGGGTSGSSPTTYTQPQPPNPTNPAAGGQTSSTSSAASTGGQPGAMQMYTAQPQNYYQMFYDPYQQQQQQQYQHFQSTQWNPMVAYGQNQGFNPYASPYNQWGTTWPSNYGSQYSSRNYGRPNQYNQQRSPLDLATYYLINQNDMMANWYGLQRWGIPFNMLDINPETMILGDMLGQGRQGMNFFGRSGQPSNLGYLALLN